MGTVLEKSDGKRSRRKRARFDFVSPRHLRGVTVGAIIICMAYIAVLFGDFLVPYHYRLQVRSEPLAPATRIYTFDEAGNFRWRLFIRRTRLVDPLALRYTEESQTYYPVSFFVHGYPYKLFGLWETDRHLFGISEENRAQQASTNPNNEQGIAPRLHLLGTDRLGRDRFSRLIIAARFSLTVAPLAALLAALLGTAVGGIAGYSGRAADALLMRVADAVISLPTLVLVLALRATQPLEIPPLRAAMLLVVIFTALGWAEIARLTRGLVLTLKTREFVTAAVSIGVKPTRILVRHIMPNAARPLVAHAVLMLPIFLLTETALSYFGAGLQEPEPSWGNMLAAANDLNTLTRQPFLLLTPALLIFIFVLGVRLVSDGIQSDEL